MKSASLDDYDRIAEMLWQNYGEAIHSRSTFDRKFDEYMGQISDESDDALREKTFKAYSFRHPIAGRIEEEQPVQKHKAVKARKHPRRKGKRQRIPSRAKRRHSFHLTGTIKGRLVYARKTYHFRSYKRVGAVRIGRLRDKIGRFVSSK
jgi:hypothetical protein